LRPEPDQAVLAWVAEHDDQIALTSITVNELWFGGLSLSPGRRRTALMNQLLQLLNHWEKRLLPYDRDAALRAAELQASRKRTGAPVGLPDTMIAGICLAGGHTLATRNTRDFEDAEISLIDPFSGR
jgi:predicted nucleic acid-binding protein